MPQLQPTLVKAKLKTVRPTQMTAGFGQIDVKVKSFKKMSAAERERKLDKLFAPGVVGPRGELFLIDHHHEAIAALRVGAKEIYLGVVADLSDVKERDFWIYLDHRSWVHCYDIDGDRRSFSEMPRRLGRIRDDPYRTLAANVRNKGGFAKSDLPFLEFLWANYFRNNISKGLLAENPKEALKRALTLSKSQKAKSLPGFAAKTHAA
jgi:hypothetical protein